MAYSQITTPTSTTSRKAMTDLPLFILIFVSVAVGWGVAKFLPQVEWLFQSKKKLFSRLTAPWIMTPDKVDELIRHMSVTDENTELLFPLALGFRKQGDFTSAIKLHQNVLAEPRLKQSIRDLALLELAKDYFAAGMLDRTEQVLLTLVEQKACLETALPLLLQLYQQTKEWSKAISAAKYAQMSLKSNMQSLLLHFYCEVADVALQKGDVPEAKSAIAATSLHYKKSHPRPMQLRLQICKIEGNFKQLARLQAEIEALYPEFHMKTRWNCTSCGFKTASHAWQCPCCKTWDVLTPHTEKESITE